MHFEILSIDEYQGLNEKLELTIFMLIITWFVRLLSTTIKFVGGGGGSIVISKSNMKSFCFSFFCIPD